MTAGPLARVSSPAGLLAVAFVLAACGAPTSEAAASPETTTSLRAATTIGTPRVATPLTQAPAPTVTLTLVDYTISPGASRVPRGEVTLSVTNRDSAPHNVVLVATGRPLERVPTIGIRVDEKSSELAVLARTRTLDTARSESTTVRLEPGLYILVCTVPHHYVRNRMAGTLTVD